MKSRFPRLAKTLTVFGAVFSGFLFSNPAAAVCVFVDPPTGKWSYAYNNPIGPATLQVLQNRFQPLGTILYDHTYPMYAMLGNKPDAVLMKCQTENDAKGAGAALRLDDTYQLGGGFFYNGIRYFFTAYKVRSDQYSPVGWKMYGVMNGTERELVFNDDGGAGNTAVRFMLLTYRRCTENGILSAAECANYPYVITAADFPSIRLVLIRSPFDVVNAEPENPDHFYARIGVILSPSAVSGSTDYGLVKLNSEYRQNAAPACGITQVPRTVDLGTYPISTIAANAASWSPFDVTYECSTVNSPVSTLRIGFEPQNRAKLHAADYHYLLPDDPGAGGVGIVYRRGGESGKRFWIQNSGCPGVSTETENHSNCSMARSQSQDQGWYTVNPGSSGSSSVVGYTQYTEGFEARMEQLPAGAPSMTAGRVSATVNVLVNQP